MALRTHARDLQRIGRVTSVLPHKLIAAGVPGHLAGQLKGTARAVSQGILPLPRGASASTGHAITGGSLNAFTSGLDTRAGDRRRSRASWRDRRISVRATARSRERGGTRLEHGDGRSRRRRQLDGAARDSTSLIHCPRRVRVRAYTKNVMRPCSAHASTGVEGFAPARGARDRRWVLGRSAGRPAVRAALGRATPPPSRSR
jgi:hypothetical protein